jgi:hypothetical protein
MWTERNSKRRETRRRTAALAVALASAAACANGSAPSAKLSPGAAALANGGRPAAAVTPPVVPPRSTVEPLLLVTDPAVLALLERRGFAFGDLVAGPGTGPADNGRLSATSHYASIADAIAADLELVRSRDPQAGVGVHRFSHRLFDVRWLRAATARFELVAVVNRLDRAPFHAKSCGETRLVYRLSYATSIKGVEVTSRLPMTVGFEVPAPAPSLGCSEIARRFQPEAPLSGPALADFLARTGGPLAAALASLTSAKLVVNVQQLRWPSAVRPDLAGHAEYLLRAFRLDGQGEKYSATTLENTPDSARLASDAALRAELLRWLSERENLKSVDAGTPLIPEKFLATRAVSVTPRGLSRAANRPFSSLFATRDVEALDFAPLRRVRSAHGLLRRLDALTCQGCHEARSIAGFHLLGDDPDATPAANAVATGVSPHLAGELARRRALVRSVLDGAQSADFSQPFPERGAYSGYGAHCGLGTDPTFAAWTCDAGLVCRPYDAPVGDGVGQCLPTEPRAAGDPCEVGPLDPKRDRVVRAERSACAENVACNTNAVGFPGGMCTETCSALSPGAVCGNIAILDPFNACVARGEPFGTCLANNVRPAGFRACDAENPCRDDYICTRSESGAMGACIPPYFLFQLRVDGHP